MSDVSIPGSLSFVNGLIGKSVPSFTGPRLSSTAIGGPGYNIIDCYIDNG